MAAMVKNPTPLYIGEAYGLFNATNAGSLPAASGKYGIDDGVWADLITLTKAKCGEKNIPVPSGTTMNGLCIWASVVAAKFLVHRNHRISSHVVRVVHKTGTAGADHYFAVAGDPGARIICDITCSQFTGAPDYLVGTLDEVKGAANKIVAFGGTLYQAYQAGAAYKEFVV
ncbi:MAG: hypothetical protein WBB25_00365 [Sulfitobacter sp.]